MQSDRTTSYDGPIRCVLLNAARPLRTGKQARARAHTFAAQGPHAPCAADAAQESGVCACQSAAWLRDARTVRHSGTPCACIGGESLHHTAPVTQLGSPAGKMLSAAHADLAPRFHSGTGFQRRSRSTRQCCELAASPARISAPGARFYQDLVGRGVPCAPAVRRVSPLPASLRVGDCVPGVPTARGTRPGACACYAYCTAPRSLCSQRCAFPASRASPFCRPVLARSEAAACTAARRRGPPLLSERRAGSAASRLLAMAAAARRHTLVLLCLLCVQRACVAQRAPPTFVTSLTGLGSVPIGLTPLTWPGVSVVRARRCIGFELAPRAAQRSHKLGAHPCALVCAR